MCIWNWKQLILLIISGNKRGKNKRKKFWESLFFQKKGRALKKSNIKQEQLEIKVSI